MGATGKPRLVIERSGYSRDGKATYTVTQGPDGMRFAAWKAGRAARNAERYGVDVEGPDAEVADYRRKLRNAPMKLRMVGAALVSAGVALLVFVAVVALAQGSGDDDRAPGPSTSVDDGWQQ